ncbi:MAG: cell wall metabolism sensor histidine kinase WalK [Christensenellaceae bacterium]|nr:cell wall metabolism sensor histidine kinase WalK [Christensenellaceae bacterium]
MRNDKYSVEKLAVNVTQLFLNADMPQLNTTLERFGGEYNARLMVLDKYGKVQVDSYGKAEGQRLNIKEVSDIINAGEASSYGAYSVNPINNKDNYINICTANLVNNQGLQGIVLFTSSLEDVISNLNKLQASILKFFWISALVSMIFALFFSSIITRPISTLTHGIEKMGKGDFSVRVAERGSKEIKNLSATFNIMSEKLENLESSRNQFISNASHELKTPLATMKILLESIIYQDDMDPEIAKEFLNDINKEIDRLNFVVKDLLTLVSLDNKAINLDRSKFSFGKLVQSICKKMALLSEQKNQNLIVDIDDECEMYADSSKLQQVVYNLVDNAVKYTGENGTINVNLRKTGRIAVLSVKDNGTGIPQEDLKNIFDRFYRVDKARSRESGGTGLGLSIVYQMIMLHGGKIYVNSEANKGTEFVVELPLAAK